MKTAAEAVAQVLEHHGVKGMKWGVRRDKQGRSRINPEGHTLKKDLIIGAAGTVIPVISPLTLTAQVRLVRALARTATDKTTGYNKDGRWQEGGKKINLTKNPAKMKEYNEGFKKEVMSPARDKHVKHADTSATNLEFEFVRDALGYIIEVKPKENSLAQAEDFITDVLEHHGVKGMKWGVRRDRTAVGSAHARTITDKAKVKTTGGTGHNAHGDAVKVAKVKQKIKKSGTAAASNKELQELIERTRLEGQAREAVASKGKKFIKKKLGSQLDSQVNQEIANQIRKKRAA